MIMWNHLLGLSEGLKAGEKHGLLPIQIHPSTFFTTFLLLEGELSIKKKKKTCHNFGHF